jgi:quercetin dioxygenase-like cupin family protein
MGDGVVMRNPGEGPATWAMGSLFEHLVAAGDTDGLFAVSLVTQPPGVATPLHRHTREAESFYVLEGELRYRAGEETYELGEGCFIYLPKGLPHAFRILGDRPARFLALTAPGGLMSLYDEVGIPALERRLPGADGQPLEVELPKWGEVGPRYGLEVVGPGLPE